MANHSHKNGTATPTSETFSFVLHAGATNSWETDLDRQRAVEKVLLRIAEDASASLRAGVPSLDVVEAAVVQLEDFELFNAGKGAALTEDGTHEVK